MGFVLVSDDIIRVKVKVDGPNAQKWTVLGESCYTSVEFLEAPRYCLSIIKTQTYIGVLFIVRLSE